VNAAVIVLDQVRKSFDGGRTYAVDGISLTVAEGETLVLLGSSGCGKTTTLKMINRLIDPTAGRITVDGRDIMQQDVIDPGDYADQHPDQLSGGQQQRVGVARALAADPDYLLMDEPFGALDALTRDLLQQELLALKQRIRKTIIFVTHDIFEALTLADRIAVMHDGGLEQIGTPREILQGPATDFVRDLFGKPAEQLKHFERHV